MAINPNEIYEDIDNDILDAKPGLTRRNTAASIRAILKKLVGWVVSQNYTPGHEWVGTALRFIRADGTPGAAVDLKGAKGEKGDKPAHSWNGKNLTFEKPDGTPGQTVDLTGPTGPAWINWRGAWTGAPNPLYKAGDGVSQAGSSYRRKADQVGAEASFNAALWDTLSEKAILADGDVTKTKLDAVLKAILDCFTVTENGDFEIVDENGWRGLILSKLGTLSVKELALLDQQLDLKLKALLAETINGVAFRESEDPKLLEAIVDENGWIGYGRRLDGTELKAPVSVRQPGIKADVIGLGTWGQSLSVPGNGAVAGVTPDAKVLTFTKGPVMVSSDGDPTRFDDFITEPGSPVGTIGRTIKAQMAGRGFAFNSTDQQCEFLMFAPGQGSQSLAELSKGTANYTRFMDCLTNAVRLCKQKGKTFSYAGFIYLQAEADYGIGTNRIDWNRRFEAHIETLNTDIKAITGQKDDIICLVYQIGSINVYGRDPRLAFGQLDLGLKGSKCIYMGPAMYSYQYADNVHLKDLLEYARCYAQAAVIMDKIIQGVDWKPIYLKDYTILGNVLELRFHVPVAPLVLDTALVANPGNYGFNLYYNGAEQPITSVAVVRPDTVKIVSASEIKPGAKITYGINGVTGKSGPTEGARGCLRDSAPETFLGYQLYDYTHFFQQDLF